MSSHENSITIMHFIGIVGEVEDNGEEKSYFMWAHKKFDVGYSDNQVCHSVLCHFCACVCMCIHMCIRTYVYVRTCVHVCPYVHICMYMHTHIYVHMCYVFSAVYRHAHVVYYTYECTYSEGTYVC